MHPKWPTVKLEQVLKHRKEFIAIDDTQIYKRCRVQIHAKGIVPRDVVPGVEIKTKKQQVCEAGEFLVAEIDAKVGGYGIVPDQLDGAIVSSHYFLFQIDEAVLNRQFLEYYIQTKDFYEQVKAQGSTNYAAIRPEQVLSYVMPLPPLSEQQRIVARIEFFDTKLEKICKLRNYGSRETDAILSSALHEGFFDPIHEGRSIKPIRSFSVILRGRGPLYLPASGKLVINQKCIRWDQVNTVFSKEASDIWVKSLPSEYFLREKDIVVNSTGEGTIGRCCVATPNSHGLPFDSHVLVVRIKDSHVIPKFLAYFLRSPYGQSAVESCKGAKTTTQTELGTAKLGDINVPILPLLEQQRIVNHLDALQTEVTKLKKLQIQTSIELDVLLPSILNKAFKGEI